MAKQATKARSPKSKKAVRRRRSTIILQPFDAKKFLGTVPAFAHITVEEMRAWRDD